MKLTTQKGEKERGRLGGGRERDTATERKHKDYKI